MKRPAQVIEAAQDSDGTISDESEAEAKGTPNAPRLIKVAWELVKEYDRNQISDEAIFEDIAQIMQNSLKDANFYSENVEQRLPTDMGYFKQSHVSIILLSVLMSGLVTDSMMSVYDSITRARRSQKYHMTFTSASSVTNADVKYDFRCERRVIELCFRYPDIMIPAVTHSREQSFYQMHKQL